MVRLQGSHKLQVSNRKQRERQNLLSFSSSLCFFCLCARTHKFLAFRNELLDGNLAGGRQKLSFNGDFGIDIKVVGVMDLQRRKKKRRRSGKERERESQVDAGPSHKR